MNTRMHMPIHIILWHNILLIDIDPHFKVLPTYYICFSCSNLSSPSLPPPPKKKKQQQQQLTSRKWVEKMAQEAWEDKCTKSEIGTWSIQIMKQEIQVEHEVEGT